MNIFLLFLLFIASVFNSLQVQLQVDVVYNMSETGTGFKFTLKLSNNGLVNSSISVRTAQGGTQAKAGQLQHNGTYVDNRWDYGTGWTNGVERGVYGLHGIKHIELKDRKLAKALVRIHITTRVADADIRLKDIDNSFRFFQGVTQPVQRFEAWTIEEASNWLASPPDAYEGAFREKCPTATSGMCQIDDEEHEGFKQRLKELEIRFDEFLKGYLAGLGPEDIEIHAWVGICRIY